MEHDVSVSFKIHMECGDRIEVTEDGDGLGCLEIRYVDDTGKACSSVTVLPEHVGALLRCIEMWREDMARLKAEPPKEAT